MNTKQLPAVFPMSIRAMIQLCKVYLLIMCVSLNYLEQYERRALPGVVVQILFTKRQQHLQLVRVNLVERHLSQQNCNTLKNISFNSSFKKDY